MIFDARELAAELASGVPTLDLHGKREDRDIETSIDQFLYQQFNRKESHLEIIYGIGRGRVKKIALPFVENHPLVEKVIDKGGSCIVLLRVHI